MKRSFTWRKALYILVGGIALLFVIEFVLLSHDRELPVMQALQGMGVSTPERSEIVDYESARQGEEYPQRLAPASPGIIETIDIPFPDPVHNTGPGADQPVPDVEDSRQGAIADPEKKPQIVVIIDDMGLSRSRTEALIALDAPLTLAFLPYAPDLEPVTRQALKAGHELLIHVPMEPLNADLDPGPGALMNEMSRPELEARLTSIFESFDGYVGINNHMGSKLTQNPVAMSWIMDALEARGLLFVDSKTIHRSVAGQTASRYQIKHIDRDVFLDHEDNAEFVKAALAKTEDIARRKGFAVAIGHPRQATISALEDWLPTLKEKGIEVVPVSAVARPGATPASEPLEKQSAVALSVEDLIDQRLQ